MADLKHLFGARLRRLRKQRALSQVDLAQRAGLSLETVARVERGSTGASFDTVEKFASALDAPVALLFGVEPTGADDPKLTGLLIKLSALDDARLAWIEGIIDAVMKKP